MKLLITCTETIKPSSPTLHHLRTHKLSFLDQLVPGAYFSIALFYSRPSHQNKTTNASYHLKKSLSKTLTRYYPYAGQLKEDLYVDCNDHGVTFIEAHAASHAMSEVMHNNNLEQLLPCESNECLSPRHNLIVQVNYFDCDGMAIAICFHHKIGDATTDANFVKTWAALASGASHNFINKEVIYNSNSMFPGRDLSVLANNKKYFTRPFLSLDSVTKRFITFSGSKTSSLREKIEGATRFEVVSIILGALIAAHRESDDESSYPRLIKAFVAVNFRKRLNPPMPEQSFGNNFSIAALNLSMEKKAHCSSLVGELGKSIRKVDDQLVRKLYGDVELLNKMSSRFAAAASSSEDYYHYREFLITSWYKMGFDEAAFGWGKSTCVGSGMRFNEAAVLVDSCEGIDVWIGLSKEDMVRFEQDPGIQAYAMHAR